MNGFCNIEKFMYFYALQEIAVAIRRINEMIHLQSQLNVITSDVHYSYSYLLASDMQGKN